ncbi:unnamed protein product [Diabrotica balteata]|uniref:Uncharacterized protein n=1 Tax=Diabrotica balteata TaxID=107213 RepID=A0A9N9TBB3_DIABA|nr:unnamed protein product [Diabrotica balteata]
MFELDSILDTNVEKKMLMLKEDMIVVLVSCFAYFLQKSHNDEDVSDGEGGHSGGEHDDLDSCDEMRRHGGLLAEHGDVLAKLKMQVRDIKVGDDYDSGGGGRSLNLNFPLSNRVMSSNGSGPDGFQLPVPFPFPHPAAAFLPPMAPQATAPSSGSSHSSEGSASSQHTWSFEEQFKQVRQDVDGTRPQSNRVKYILINPFCDSENISE